ncbi:MAG TPA: aminotransferase class I/II-fold pyridoxal phosphate-dependent enzyme [Nocardioidaceae bacterium]|nr:aminotransferase class I/II-fold pyridoxal phosphate-dependent enzyme [Nocardioidaceae bacterium]
MTELRAGWAGLSDRSAAIPASGIRAIAAAAWARPGTVRLELGEPRHDTAEHIVAAADRAARDGRTHYGPTAGLPEFRAAVAEKLVRDNGWPAEAAVPDRVVTAAGGVGALFAAYAAVLDSGDEILVPDPGWPNFRGLASAVGARAVGYPTDPVTGGAPPTDTLDSLTGPATRAILINSPSNPTSSMWSRADLAAVGDWAAGRGLWVISDECYDMLGLDVAPLSAAVAAPAARTITVFSLSKTYAMTGWRLGYATGPTDAVAAMTRVLEATASCPSTVTQSAGVAALLGPQDAAERMRRSYAETRDVAVAEAERLGLGHIRPVGGFYLWLTLPPTAPSSDLFAVDLVERRGVAVAPGSAFGPAGQDRLRLSLAAPADDVVTGLRAIAAALEGEGS